MDKEKPRKRHTQFSRSARTKRILERLREGWAYDEVAREEGLTARRVRQIVTEFLQEREALGDVAHAHMQIDRLGRVMRVASEALARGVNGLRANAGEKIADAARRRRSRGQRRGERRGWRGRCRLGLGGDRLRDRGRIPVRLRNGGGRRSALGRERAFNRQAFDIRP
jgi:hypothetical protein